MSEVVKTDAFDTPALIAKLDRYLRDHPVPRGETYSEQHPLVLISAAREALVLMAVLGSTRRFTPADVEVAARAIAVQACGGRDDWTKWQAFDRECYFKAARAALRSVGTLEEDEDHG